MKTFDIFEIGVRNLTPRNLPFVAQALGRCVFIEPGVGCDDFKTRIRGELA